MSDKPSFFVKLTPISRKVIAESDHFSLVETTISLSRMESNTVNKVNILDIDRIAPSGLGHLSIRDAEYLAGFNKSYLRELCQLKKIEALKHKGVWFISREALANHLIHLASVVEQQIIESTLSPEQHDFVNRRLTSVPEPHRQSNSLASIQNKKRDKSPSPNLLVPIKVLFIAANPNDTVRLKLDEEIRSIDDALRQSEYRDQFDIRQHWAVRVSDLQHLLLRYRPDIVHFSGHGSANSEIVLEDNFGKSQAVSPHALSRVFSILKDNIRCVLLNSCYSELQADAISEHIDCVIGMSKAIGDLSATTFAVAFYRALGYGRDVKTAFELGCSHIELEDLGDENIPLLIAKRNDPQNLFFAHMP